MEVLDEREKEVSDHHFLRVRLLVDEVVKRLELSDSEQSYRMESVELARVADPNRD